MLPIESSVSMLPEFQIHFDVLPESSKQTLSDKDSIDLPLYSNSSREHLICSIKVNTTVDKQTIVLAGVAFIVPDGTIL